MKYIFSLVLLLCILIPDHRTAHAGGIPVYDASGHIQAVLQATHLADQITQMKAQYEQQLLQLQEAVNQVEAVTGVRGIGNLLNTSSYKNARRYAPISWQDTLNILEAGGQTGSVSSVKNYYQKLAEESKIATSSQIDPDNPTSPHAMAHERRRTTTLAAHAVSQEAYDQTAARTDIYETLMTEIENTPNTKASSDLANRIAVENGITSNDQNRLMSVMIQQISTEHAQALQDRAEAIRISQYRPLDLYGNPLEQEK